MLNEVTEKFHLYHELNARCDPWRVECCPRLERYSDAEICARLREIEAQK